MKRVVSFLLAVGLHVAIVILLLRDHVVSPVDKIGHPIVVNILHEEQHEPESVELAPLELQTPRVVLDPPRVDWELGKIAPPQPMVVIGARFIPGPALVVLASKYSQSLSKISSVYRADISVLVLPAGDVGSAYIEHSDGNPDADNFIIWYARDHWRFIPSISDGMPVASWKTVTVDLTPQTISWQ